MREELKSALCDYWCHQYSEARDLQVDNCKQFHGGASRDTYGLTLHYRVGEDALQKNLVLRIMPEGCLLSEEISQVETEFAAMRALEGSGIPVPRAYFLERDTRWMGQPFIVLEEITGCEASASGLTKEPYCHRASQIGRRFYSLMGTLATIDHTATELARRFEAPELDACWSRELAVWEQEATGHGGLPPMPVLAAAQRWLHANPPPPAPRLSLVHGDFRAGNFLYNAAGEIEAILDWELCHLGDPHEDLAWSMLPAWSGGEPNPGRMLTREESISQWEGASGLRVDPVSLHWWEVFANMKLVIALACGGVEFRQRRNLNPQLVVASWYAQNLAMNTLAKLLAAHSQGEHHAPDC
jgi:aminoglycoside phosphotransferase (APT) family kinase protein